MRLVNIFEIYKTPLAHYQKSYDRASRFIKRELIPRVVEVHDGHLKYKLFELISSKGSALFKNVANMLDSAFGRVEVEEPVRIETEKVRTKKRRELDLQIRAFKEFIDLEENQRASTAKQQQTAHQSFRMLRELAALMVLTRIFYVKLEQEENQFSMHTQQKPVMTTPAL